MKKWRAERGHRRKKRMTDKMREKIKVEGRVERLQDV